MFERRLKWVAAVALALAAGVAVYWMLPRHSVPPPYDFRKSLAGDYLVSGGIGCLSIRKLEDGSWAGYWASSNAQIPIEVDDQGLLIEYSPFMPRIRHIPSVARRGDFDRICGEPESAIALRSYLTKIESADARYHFQTVEQYCADGQTDKELLSASAEAVERLLEDHPRNPAVRILYLNSLALREKIDDLTHKLNEWEPAFKLHRCPVIDREFHYMRLTAQSLVASSNGENLYDILETQSNMGLDEFIISARNLPLDLDYYPRLDHIGAPSRHDLTTAHLARLRLYQSVAVLAPFVGRRQLGEDMSIAMFILGRTGEWSHGFWAGRMGELTRFKASRLIRYHCNNVCLDAEDTRRLFDRFEAVCHRNDRLSEEELRKWFRLHEPTEPDFDFGEFITSSLTLEAELALTRGVLAARHSYFVNGEFPWRDGRNADGLLLSRPPDDPYSGTALQTKYDRGSMTLFSVGPDRHNDHGQTIYDPTNGVVSAGDIVATALAQPKYPFPRDGIRASTREELHRLFPDGLPPVGFPSDPLLAIEGPPVIVLSIGPDRMFSTNRVTQGEYWRWIQMGEYRTETEFPPIGYRPDVLYDPTNGLDSDGDLWVELKPSDKE